MKYILTITLLLSSLLAKPIDIGDTLPDITLKDQFGRTHSIDKNVSKIIITFDKKSSIMANKFISLKKDSSHYLSEHNMAFVANISKMPSLITKLFAMPKMKKYKHTILLIDDKKNDLFKSEKKHITIYELQEGIVRDIKYIRGIKELNTTLLR